MRRSRCEGFIETLLVDHLQRRDDPQVVNGGSVTSGAVSAFPQNGAVIADPAMVNDGGSSTTTDVAAAYPRGGLDLPNIAFGARTALAYAENGANTGGTLTVTDGRHAASIALLGNYMAASFVTAADGHGGTLISEEAQPRSPQLSLTAPHTG